MASLGWKRLKFVVQFLDSYFFNQANTISWISYSHIQTDNFLYSVSDFHLKDGPPVQFESELKMSGDPTSLIDMRNLSNERTGVCGEEFPNKLQSVLRKTEVRM
jgi:hypothetical protein